MEDATCSLHQHVLKCCDTQCCSCMMQRSVPTFEVKLGHVQELDSLARTERVRVDGQIKLRLSDHTDTGGIFAI